MEYCSGGSLAEVCFILPKIIILSSCNNIFPAVKANIHVLSVHNNQWMQRMVEWATLNNLAYFPTIVIFLCVPPVMCLPPTFCLKEAEVQWHGGGQKSIAPPQLPGS